MKKYNDAVYWIAMNDNDEDLDEDSISNNITVALIADLFKKSDQEVAKAVLKIRLENRK
jgi:hypothetical protein